MSAAEHVGVDEVVSSEEGAKIVQEEKPSSNNKWWKNTEAMTEKDVGILQTIGKYGKILGTIKERFSHFHVNEIDLDGNIVRLTNQDVCPEISGKPKVDLSETELKEWVGDDQLKLVEELQNADKTDQAATLKTLEFNVTNMSKEERTKFHGWAGNFDNLTSETVDKSGVKYIVLKHRTKDPANKNRRPATRARYTHCVLYKEGIETSDAINFLSRKLRLNPNLITYAGNKDKRAKTTQRLCISNMDARRLVDINLFSSQSKLGNFTYSPNKINLGDLKGNHFRILIKDIHSPSNISDLEVDDCIEKGVQSLTANGFINYYGLQRFGSFNIPTHLIGKTLLQMKWDDLFDLILQVKPTDSGFLRQAKNVWLKDRDAQRAKKLIPDWHRSIESNLIYGLAKHYHEKDYLSALHHIPRNVRMLYIHAFQSFIWNNLVTYRLREFGHRPIVGDLVFANAELNDSFSEGVDLAIEDINLPDEIELNQKNETKPEGNVNISSKSKPEIKILGENDLENYSIFDILLPLDGAEIQYPKNSVQDYVKVLLEESGVSPDYLSAFKGKYDTPKGAYRKIVVLPTNVSCKISSYSEGDSLDFLIPSDFDLLRIKESKKESVKNDSLNEGSTPEKAPNDKKCLQIEFSLPSSSYATMALREILMDAETEEEAEIEGPKRKSTLEENVSSEIESKKIKLSDGACQEGVTPAL